MPSIDSIGVGVIGLGFIGRAHVNACLAAQQDSYPCRLTALCDADPVRVDAFCSVADECAPGATASSAAIPAGVHRFSNAEEMICDPSVSLVCICTYTETHVPLAMRALLAGKHVLVEKPVAMSAAAMQPLLEAATQARTLCMPAMCMRFWPGWDWLHERIADRSFGPVQRAEFQRLGTTPAWSSFYADHARSGAAMLDLHVHDVDFIHWCFGAPASVASTGSEVHVATEYQFADSRTQVTAEGAWNQQPSAGFQMKFLVTFRDAVADFDLAREPKLLLRRGSHAEPVPLPDLTGYDGQLRHMIDVISGKAASLRATLEESAAVLQMIEAERRSLAIGQPVKF